MDEYRCITCRQTKPKAAFARTNHLVCLECRPTTDGGLPSGMTDIAKLPNETHYERGVRRRKLAAEALGNRCARCGIAYPLDWDHINDDGGGRRTAGGRRYPLDVAHRVDFIVIINTGHSDLLQLLCPNCNRLKHIDRAEYDRPPTYGPLPM